MIVSRASFNSIVGQLEKEPYLSLDFETYGLRMYHGHGKFSLILATATEGFYFNFKVYADSPEGTVLEKEHWTRLGVLFKDASKTWFIQNAANFDLCVAAVEGFELAGTIHCTQAIGRVEYNDHFGDRPYSLDAQLKRLGHHKDDKVANYIDEHKLWTDVPIPGKEKPDRQKHFDKVPWDIIVPYGLTDGKETFFLGQTQIASLERQDQEQPRLVAQGRVLQNVLQNERRLQKTIFRMKHRGVLIDRPYCEKAARFEEDRQQKACDIFKRETGRDFMASSKLFADIFGAEKDKWLYTEKGNPSFDSDALARFEHPAARAVLEMRDAKAKADFYWGFLWHADYKGFVHPDFDPGGTVHGRFSSKNPNFQNLKKDEDEEEIAQEFIVRRAIIPRPGFVLIMPDYDQMEYKFMMDQACTMEGRLSMLAGLVLDGVDFHEATAQNAKAAGAAITRSQAKTTNFLTLYGGGNAKLASNLKVTLAQAEKIRGAIIRSAPEINAFISSTTRSAKQRGFVVNWMGRRSHFANPHNAYRAPNYIVSGGCADIVKIAMNRIDDYLLSKKSKLIMTVHDELPIEVHESEIDEVPPVIQQIMEMAFVGKYLPLTTGMDWSDKSLGDKRKGFPV